MKLVLVIAAVVASSVLLVPTVAQASTQAVEQVSTTVRHRSGESATLFQQRLSSKARKMCAEGRANNLALRADTERCVAAALRSVQ